MTIKGHKLCTTYWPVPVGEIERGEKIPHSVNTLFYSFFPFLFNLIMLSLPSFSLCQEAEIIKVVPRQEQSDQGVPFEQQFSDTLPNTN